MAAANFRGVALALVAAEGKGCILTSEPPGRIALVCVENGDNETIPLELLVRSSWQKLPLLGAGSLETVGEEFAHLLNTALNREFGSSGAITPLGEVILAGFGGDDSLASMVHLTDTDGLSFEIRTRQVMARDATESAILAMTEDGTGFQKLHSILRTMSDYQNQAVVSVVAEVLQEIRDSIDFSSERAYFSGDLGQQLASFGLDGTSAWDDDVDSDDPSQVDLGVESIGSAEWWLDFDADVGTEYERDHQGWRGKLEVFPEMILPLVGRLVAARLEERELSAHHQLQEELQQSLQGLGASEIARVLLRILETIRSLEELGDGLANSSITAAQHQFSTVRYMGSEGIWSTP